MKKGILISIVFLFFLLILYVRRNFPHTKNIINQLPSAGSYPTRDLNQITDIVIHHSAWDDANAFDYANLHVSDRGWPGIGYHYVIDQDGTINQTNSLNTASYHVQGYNTQAIGICISGDLDQHPMTASQKRSVKKIIRYLRIRFGKKLIVKPHKDYKSTDCPGRFVNIKEFQ